MNWNLMIGKPPLWVAQPHGHSVATMLRVYTAWMDNAPEWDIATIKYAMGTPPSPAVPATNTTANPKLFVKVTAAMIATASRLF